MRSDEPKKLYHTFSVWLVAIGLAGASHRKTRVAAAGALLLGGLGYFGVLWERYARADLRNFRQLNMARQDPFQLVLHAGMVALGAGLLRWSARVTVRTVPSGRTTAGLNRGRHER